MEKILYQDDEFSVVSYQVNDVTGKFIRYIPSESKFVVIVPYKKSMGKYSYLIKRELVKGWDEHPDLCGISLPLKYAPEVSAVYALKDILGKEFEQKDLIHLGVCAASKMSDYTYYLFSMNLSDYDEVLPSDDVMWVDEQTLVEALDAQLVTTVARLKFLI